MLLCAATVWGAAVAGAFCFLRPLDSAVRSFLAFCLSCMYPTIRTAQQYIPPQSVSPFNIFHETIGRLLLRQNSVQELVRQVNCFRFISWSMRDAVVRALFRQHVLFTMKGTAE